MTVDLAAPLGEKGRRMEVEITEVTPFPSNDLITAACLDRPRTGPVDRCAFQVSGWVVSKALVREIEFVHELSVIARCELDVSRPDVASEYGSSSLVGFWKAIGTVGLAPAFTVGVEAVFQDGRRRRIAEIRGTQQLTSTFTPSMQPIMVTSPGRSGSTLLMRMLAEHPDIIVHERFPYETYVFSHWMHFIQVLATPGDIRLVESFPFWRDPERLPRFPYCLDPPFVHPTPTEDADVAVGLRYTDWYATDQVEEFARVAQAAVESFYREYASARKSTTPAFFAEKIVLAGRYDWLMRQLYPRGREIFLVRDPRDRLASVLAFNARFPTPGWDRDRVETDEEYVDIMREEMVSLIQLREFAAHRSLLVRYEDLVRSPTEGIRAMLDALELDSSVDIVNSMAKAGNETTSDVISHQTSPNIQSSIGRWKRDLEPRLQKICDEAFGGLLDELGGSLC
jgi:hypothetical protein